MTPNTERLPSRNLDLVIIVGYTVVTVVFIIQSLPSDSPARIILGIPFIFFIPGYVTTAVLFPDDPELDIIEQIALSIGLSICIVILTGFFLNYTPFGIRVPSILFALSVITFILTIGCVWRRIPR